MNMIIKLKVYKNTMKIMQINIKLPIKIFKPLIKLI